MSFIALLALLVLPARAGGPGTSAAPLFSFDWGGRPAAMGGAFVGAADDVNASLWNPAGLAFTPQPVVSASHAALWQGVTFDQLAASFPVGPRAGLGGHFAYMTSGPIDRTTEDPGGSFNALGPGGTFRDSEVKLNLAGAGAPVPWLGLGGAINYFRDAVDQNTVDSFMIDMGAMARGGMMTYGLSLQNVGPQVHGQDTMPTVMRLGAAARPSDGFLLTAEYDYHFESFQNVFAMGAEYEFGRNFAFRMGMLRPSGAGQPSVRLTWGFGAGLGAFHLDYAYAAYAEIGHMNQISLSYTFGSKRGRKISAPEPPPTRKPEADVTVEERFMRADVMIEAKNYLKAKEELAAALALLAAEDRRRIRYFDRMGRISLMQNELDAAQTAFTDGLRMGASLGLSDPDVADVYAGMGECLAAKGNGILGIRFLEKSLEFHPSPKTKAAVEAKLKELKAKK